MNLYKLRKDLLEKADFIIYGCGLIATEVYTELKKIQLLPQYCVITEKKKENEVFFDMPVYEINDKADDIRKKNTCVVLAVNERNREEIEKTLLNLGITNYIGLSSFLRKTADEYWKMSTADCLEEVASWHLEHLGEFGKDPVEEVHAIQEWLANRKINERKIIFVVGALTPRTIKIMQALLKCGFEVEVLASPIAVLQQICMNQLESLEVTIIKCQSLEELIYRLLISDGKVVHLFTHRGHSHYDRVLIKHKSLFAPIVYDEYDVVGVFYTNEPQVVIDNEKYCLENVAGVCNRGFEIEYLVNEHNYKIKGYVIQFQDYCNEIQCVNGMPTESEMSLCYVGGILAYDEWPEFADGFLELAEECRKNKCHFHVYPIMWDTSKYVFYKEMEKNNTYFHLHMPISFEKLAEEISMYDYGVFPIKRKILTQKTFMYNTHEKAIYGTTNKYFDYLDAGLPIVAAHSRKQIDFFEKIGVVLDWTIEDYDFDELRRRKKELKEKVILEREKLRMSNQIHKLVDLFDSISKGRRGL